jgi:hypothetical protein
LPLIWQTVKAHGAGPWPALRPLLDAVSAGLSEGCPVTMLGDRAFRSKGGALGYVGLTHLGEGW